MKWNRLLYGALAVFWIGLGIMGVLGFASGTADEIHVSREAGAGAVFVGWMHLWCARNQAKRMPVHLGLMLFTGLMAAIHWREWLVGARTLTSPLVNSVPFVVLAVMLAGWRSSAGTTTSHGA